MAVELVETRISPDILDTIGKSFKFRHGIGVAEWLKNSLDHYLRLVSLGRESIRGAWPVIIDLIDGTTAGTGPNLTVIDFGGTSCADVEEFFLHWGDRSAATSGGRVSGVHVTGGHGNGGKFYMREMWKNGARFATWRDGKSTSLVVERRSDGKTGFWEFRDRTTDWHEALESALGGPDNLGGAEWVIGYIEANWPNLVAQLDQGLRGFTVLAGRRARQALSSNDVVRGNRWDYQKLVDSIIDAPQARRPLNELSISIFVNGQLGNERLSLAELTDDPDRPMVQYDVPASVIADNDLSTGESTVGIFRLRKASTTLVGHLRPRNSVAVMDSNQNPVASYAIKDLPLQGYSPLLEFYHGELNLTFSGLQALVQNDRERLLHSETTSLILNWVAERVWEQVKAIEKEQREANRRSDLEIASVLNEQLNKYARSFLQELQTQMYVDLVDEPSGGGQGNRRGGGPTIKAGVGSAGEIGRGGTDREGKGSGGEGPGGGREVPGTKEPVNRPRFPQVLLSSVDANPASPTGETKHLTDRHPPLDQDDQDKLYNVWWINTDHAFAKAALVKGGSRGPNFKSYQLHMIRDVVQREALRYRQHRESELSLDIVENELSDISNRFLAELPVTLTDDLLT